MVRDSECFKNLERQFLDHRNEELWELKKDDKLFGPGEEHFWDMDLDFIGGELQGHIWAYKRAADHLIAVIICGDHPLGDYADVYPVIALYRHYIELELKSIIYTAHSALERPMSRGLEKNISGRRGHQIKWLWNRAKILVRMVGADDTEELTLMDHYIDQVDSVPYDLGRYPWTARGEELELPDQCINLITLRVFMERVGGYLRGVADYLEELRSNAYW